MLIKVIVKKNMNENKKMVKLTFLLVSKSNKQFYCYLFNSFIWLAINKLRDGYFHVTRIYVLLSLIITLHRSHYLIVVYLAS